MSGMSLAQANELAAVADGYASDTIEVRPDYSGRGMYGATCPAIVLTNPDDLIALAYAAGEIGMSFDEVPQRTDDMGMGIVVY